MGLGEIKLGDVRDYGAADAAKALRTAQWPVHIVGAGKCAIGASVVNMACAYGDAGACRHWLGLDIKWY